MQIMMVLTILLNLYNKKNSLKFKARSRQLKNQECYQNFISQTIDVSRVEDTMFLKVQLIKLKGSGSVTVFVKYIGYIIVNFI